VPVKTKPPRVVLVGVWANRNWILGNWLRELRKRKPSLFRIRWTPFIYANRYLLEKVLITPLPKSDSYFFSYPTIFRRYLSMNPMRFRQKSMVLYPHHEEEMGTIHEQVSLLNESFAVYFFCSRDAERLVANGLHKHKVRLAYCAVDVDCIPTNPNLSREKIVVLASRFGPRKGLAILPEIVQTMPDYRFVALGRGWHQFITRSGLSEFRNFEHHEFNLESRNTHFSRASTFLSLSTLEGGPVPLLEAIALGCNVVATDTGFSRDLIRDGVDGILLNTSPTVDEVVRAIAKADILQHKPDVSWLTWDRITRLTLQDASSIQFSTSIRARG
jgi:glycosyltransferase involved in cell wall biosynthesis